MSQQPKIKVTLLIIAFSLAVVYGVKFFLGIMPQNTLSSGQTRAKGDKGAAIQITEFIDLECPACARGAEYLGRMRRPAGIILAVS